MVSKSIKYHSLKGSDRVKDLIMSFKNDVVVYFDPDVDGMVSGYFVCKLLSLLGKRFQWYVNSNRSHNWGIDVGKLKGKDVIAVDFMIPEILIEDIVRSGSNIISMDHHINTDSFINVCINGKVGIVINNQYPFEEIDGRYLSGAGVVFETLRLIDSRFDTVENRALVGLTLLSDVCDIENDLARGYLYDLYNHKCKGYIKYLIDSTMGSKDFNFGVPRLDRKYVDYKFSPAINSCLRFNRQDDIVRFFLGGGNLDLSYHKRQKFLVKSMIKVARVVEFSHLMVVYVKDWEVETDEDRSILSNFVGLLASNYLNGKSVVAYVIGREEGKSVVRRASFRGNMNSLNYLKATEGVLNGVGHPSAFGILDIVPCRELFNRVNDLCKDIEKDSTKKVNAINVVNLSIFANRQGYDYAEHNIYCLVQNSLYVRYVGSNIKVSREGAAYRKYKVDGIEVTSFDLNLDFSSGLIYPVLERGYIYYYLQKV